MYKGKKLLQSVSALRTALQQGFAMVVYVKKNDPYTIRVAIATTCLDYVPFEMRPQTPYSAANHDARRITYFEFTELGEPVGWRCFIRKNMIGWCEYVPVQADDDRAPRKQLPQRIED